MSTVTMTMIEALNKKKLLEARVAEFNKASSNPMIKTAAYISYITDAELNKQKTLTEAEISAALQSNFNSRLHTIKNLTELKCKINESNAITKISVGGKEYTIADAIARHRAIETELNFLKDVEKQYTNAINNVEQYNAKARDPKLIAEHVAAITASLPKVPEEMLSKIKESYIQENTVRLIDPNNLGERIKAWRDEIEQFESELHAAMITSNIQTVITCEFED